ncbi:MAG: DNA repair protein RecO [Lachnospiraceae bacterium]|nr:DNA repair protein RecO [Lachnospiraceae bacterium]
MNLETVTGMVLSAMPIGEYDKRLVILTKEFGRISAFAKGARKPNSVLLAPSQPFAFGVFTLYQGRSSYTVNSADIQNYFEELRTDLEKIAYGMYFCEVAAHLTYENVEAVGILKLLYQSLKALNKEKLPKEMVRSIFEIKVLDFNGETPRVFECVKCRKKPTTESRKFYAGFSSKAGGMVCSCCREGVPDILKISETTIYTLQYIISSKVEKLFTFLLKKPYDLELKQVAAQYMEYYTDGNFQSLEMLKDCLQ